MKPSQILAGILLCALCASVVAGSRWIRLYNPAAISADSTAHIYLNNKTSLDSLTTLLTDSGYVKNRSEFLWAAHLLGWRNFREGHYKIGHSYSYNELLSKLAKGIQDPVSITILPGKTKSAITDAVSKRMRFDSLAFSKVLNDSLLLNKLNLQQKQVIGRFYPNTYSFYWTATPATVFKKIIHKFDELVIQPNEKQFQNNVHSVNDIITMASIIEWESKNDAEKRTISGLYWNRIKKGMPLQSDPTVNFAIGERRRLLYEDYKVKDPYNTYLHRGLPPGPITNPSISSIKAALNPEDNSYLYMVASPDGTHDFSRTFAEHKRKSAKWRKWLQKQYRIKRRREAQQDTTTTKN